MWFAESVVEVVTAGRDTEGIGLVLLQIIAGYRWGLELRALAAALVLYVSPHLVGRGNEERGDQRGKKFARGCLVQNKKRVLVQTSVPRLAEIIEEKEI